jgi:hypothetical protein
LSFHILFIDAVNELKTLRVSRRCDFTQPETVEDFPRVEAPPITGKFREQFNVVSGNPFFEDGAFANIGHPEGCL